MALNPHQFVGQQLWYARGTSIRGPITVGTVEDDPAGFFISDPNTKIRHSVGHGELHPSEESARAHVQSVKNERKAAKARRQSVPQTNDMAQLSKFLGVPQENKKK